MTYRFLALDPGGIVVARVHPSPQVKRVVALVLEKGGVATLAPGELSGAYSLTLKNLGSGIPLSGLWQRRGNGHRRLR
jgi:hypothetical protein